MTIKLTTEWDQRTHCKSNDLSRSFTLCALRRSRREERLEPSFFTRSIFARHNANFLAGPSLDRDGVFGFRIGQFQLYQPTHFPELASGGYQLNRTDECQTDFPEERACRRTTNGLRLTWLGDGRSGTEPAIELNQRIVALD